VKNPNFGVLQASIIVTASLASLVANAFGQQPSFNCAIDKGPDERTICASFSLSEFDRQLNNLYRNAINNLSAADQIQLREAQRGWLKRRAACSLDAICIEGLYRARIPELQALLALPPQVASPQQQVLPQSVAPTQPEAWYVNGSTVRQRSNGPELKFEFQYPRGNYAAQGAIAGALLFEGQKDGSQVSGVAYEFSSGCDAESYEVTGTVSSDDRSVVLKGRAPTRDVGCKITSYRDEILSFSKR
jgi:uncharacterized protein